MTQLGIELRRQKGSVSVNMMSPIIIVPFVGTSLVWSYIEVTSDIHTSMNKNSVFQASLFSMLYI